MKLTITIETGNDAFWNNSTVNEEIARILHKYADRIHEGTLGALDTRLVDTNGNVVGKAEYGK